MTLKITKASDPITVNRITTCLYGEPGVGKSSIGSTADQPLLLDFDQGAYRSAFRKDIVQIAAWADVEGMNLADLDEYKTVVVDTVGRALDKLTTDIIRQNPKMKGYGGALSLQGYGALKSAFVSWIKLLHSYGKDVVLLAHSEEQKNGEATVTRLDVQGGSKSEIYKVADAMARLYIVDGKRTLNFSPTEVSFGKNPGQLPILTVPDFTKEPNFLGGIIQSIKEKLNAGNQATTAEQEALSTWRNRFGLLDGVEDFNNFMTSLQDESPKVKSLYIRAAEAKGFKFDKKAKQFVGVAS